MFLATGISLVVIFVLVYKTGVQNLKYVIFVQRLQRFRKSNAKLKCPAFKLLTADANEMDHIAFN